MSEEYILQYFASQERMVKGELSLHDSENCSNQNLIVDLKEQLKPECCGKQEFVTGATE